MKPLTDMEQDVILKAAEYIAAGKQRYSCFAIKRAAMGRIPFWHDLQLRKRYAQFWGFQPYQYFVQPWDRKFFRSQRGNGDIRVLMLMWFLEANT